jgi:magnesium-transporting ATPase (P-type)
VGDLVKVLKDTEFPADLLVVGAPKEVVYVDTMNLDGETNLKEKYLFDKNLSLSSSDNTLPSFSGHVICDPPNPSLDDWNANVHYGNNSLVNCK